MSISKDDIQRAKMLYKINEINTLNSAIEENANDNFFSFISSLDYFQNDFYQEELETQVKDFDGHPIEALANCAIVNETLYYEGLIKKNNEIIKRNERIIQEMESKLRARNDQA